MVTVCGGRFAARRTRVAATRAASPEYCSGQARLGDTVGPALSVGLIVPQTAIEVVNAVKREGFTPDTFIGMHVAATPWTRLTGVLDSLARQ
jgi:hypothetical protein